MLDVKLVLNNRENLEIMIKENNTTNYYSKTLISKNATFATEALSDLYNFKNVLRGKLTSTNFSKCYNIEGTSKDCRTSGKL